MWQWALIIMAPGNKGARNTWRSREAASLCCYPNKASSQILRRTRGDPEAVLLPALELSACLELLSQCCSVHSNPHAGTFRFPALMWNGHVPEEEETLPQADGASGGQLWHVVSVPWSPQPQLKPNGLISGSLKSLAFGPDPWALFDPAHHTFLAPGRMQDLSCTACCKQFYLLKLPQASLLCPAPSALHTLPTLLE